jgi:hypothetical protein
VIFAPNSCYRCDEETMLRRMLNLPSFHVRIRGDPRPSNVIIEIVNINDDDEMERIGRAQLTFVKTRAEAEAFAAKWNVKCHHSKLSQVDKSSALNALATMGTPIVATYGLSVGVNIKVKGKSVSSVDIYGMCLSLCWRMFYKLQNASSLTLTYLQLKNMTRFAMERGFLVASNWPNKEWRKSSNYSQEHCKSAKIVLCSVQRLHLTALYQADWSVYSVEEQELVLMLMCNDLDGIFDLFADKGTNVERLVHSSTTYDQHRLDALQIQHYDPNEYCAICFDLHRTSRCHVLNGICYQCGVRAYRCNCRKPGSSIAQVTVDTPDTHTCTSCKLPLYVVAGTKLHTSNCGHKCERRALADTVKMLLLAGQVSGETFGPSSYKERVVWATEGSPPNILSVLARVARKQQALLPAIRDIDAVYSRCIPGPAPKRAQQLSSPGDATTPLHGLKRESSSLGSSQALPSPVQTVRTTSTPETSLRGTLKNFFQSAATPPTE